MQSASRFRILHWIPTALFIVSFLLLLLVFDILQRLGKARSRHALDRVNVSLSRNILRLLKICGTKYKFDAAHLPPAGTPVIVVSNHQSMFDICLSEEILTGHFPRFIAKLELSRWIPGVSFNLRSGGHALIDRKTQSQALREILRLGKFAQREGLAVVIYPEGTRARDGVLKHFKPAGLVALMRAMPNAKLLPLVIDGSWRVSSGMPVPFGVTIQVSLEPALDPTSFASPNEAIEAVRRVIARKLEALRSPLEPACLPPGR